MITMQMRVKEHILAILVLLLPLMAVTQSTYPEDYFRSPVDYRILLSGTFGELRAGHFHSGMDIKTGGVSGKNIYAVADGYVSRIKVSATGFGKTLYVTHPNGFISVYAHLSRFNQNIAPYVKARHYEYESFELNIFPEKGKLPVKKGEVIAYSGNSGGSNGPHLHFEMRLEKTQTPVNPLLFGFDVKDYIRPSISWLKVYPLGDGSRVDGQDLPRVFKIDGWGEKHRVQGYDTIQVNGSFSLAINTWDKLNDANNKNGVYRIELYADTALIYSHDLEKFNFSETRYINSLIDYYDYIDTRRRYQRTEIDPNNKLSIYDKVVNSGILSFPEAGIYELEYVVRDFEGNVSRLPIVVDYSPNIFMIKKMPPPGSVYFSIDSTNVFEAENIRITLPGSSLYRDLWFVYDTLPGPDEAFSRVHRIQDDRTALHRNYAISIVPDSIPRDPSKLMLARITDDGDYIPYGGEWDRGMLDASISSFGDFVILVDTIPPEVHSVNIASGIIKPDRKTVKVRIKDERSGIKKYRAELNGNWLLMEYDAKNNLLTYHIDDRLKPGENELVIELTDQCDNKTVYRKTLIRK
ncbi:MAG: M23 family metallopeptidase [Bacteroidales bacterium]|nr:M23 family metallopeptidase [Bacteroidales bacterium]